MIEYLNEHVISIMLVITLVLLILTLMVVILAIYYRWLSVKKEDQEKLKKERFGELIIQYVNGDLGLHKIQEKIEGKTDHLILLQLVNSLSHSLEGREKVRLQELMELRSLKNHFNRYLESSDPIRKAYACQYLSRLKSVSSEKIPVLINLTTRKEPILAYAAALAVIVHGSAKQKENVLRNMLYNQDISLMVLSDLFLKFNQIGDEYRQNELATLTGFVRDEEIQTDRRALVIKILNELEYLDSVDVLYNMYKEVLHSTVVPEILEALIKILTKFGVEEILGDIHRFYTSSDSFKVRRASAFSMGFFQHEDSKPYLKWLINDPDYRVRFEAARALGIYPDIDMEQIRCEVLSQKEWDEMVNEIKSIHG
ncbi:MAG: HEAT repeat domain-containing protein [Balneolaceae bacterium]